MDREISIAAIQIPAFLSGKDNRALRENNFRSAEHWLHVAGERCTDIACLGEHFNAIGQEVDAQNMQALMDGVTEETLERFTPIARQYEMNVIAPVWAMVDGVLRNAALVIRWDGTFLGAYCKVHPTEMERRLGVVPGEDWPVFDLGVGTVGVQICHDNSFPESARCLALQGAEVIFWPHVMSGWGDVLMDIMLRSPAIYNGVYHVPVCFGSDPNKAWRPGMLLGRSSVIAPDGTIVADAGRFPGIASATLDLDKPRIAHDFTRSGDHVWREDMLDERRPDTYTPITHVDER